MGPFVKSPFEAGMLSAVQKKNLEKNSRNKKQPGTNSESKTKRKLGNAEHKYIDIAAKRRAAKRQNELEQSNQLRENWMGYNKS